MAEMAKEEQVAVAQATAKTSIDFMTNDDCV